MPRKHAQGVDGVAHKLGTSIGNTHRRAGKLSISASHPDQLRENTAAVGRTPTAKTLTRIDTALLDDGHGDLVERDPQKVAQPFDVMPAWKA